MPDTVTPAVGGFVVEPQARLRRTTNDGMNDKDNLLGAANRRAVGYDLDEASVFASTLYRFSGVYAGGSLSFIGLLGYNHLNVDHKVGGGGSDTDSFVYGGTLVWSAGSTYLGLTTVGHTGQTDMRITNVGAANSKVSVDTDGYILRAVGGQTVPLSGGTMLDLKVMTGMARTYFDDYRVVATNFRAEASELMAGFTPTLFQSFKVDGGVLRPYLQGTVKWVHRSADLDLSTGANAASFKFSQQGVFGGAELGLDYTTGPWKFGAGAYIEGSDFETTYGGRVGASYRLN